MLAELLGDDGDIYLSKILANECDIDGRNVLVRACENVRGAEDFRAQSVALSTVFEKPVDEKLHGHHSASSGLDAIANMRKHR